jgi:hypothetical protein
MTGAAAAQPIQASGTWTTTSANFTGQRTVGTNTIVDITYTGIKTGTFDGTVVGQGYIVFHADGTAENHTVEVFTGTVNGTPGTVTFNVPGPADASGSLKGNLSIMSGTGELANLHGTLHLVGSVPPCCLPEGTYAGTITFGGS